MAAISTFIYAMDFLKVDINIVRKHKCMSGSDFEESQSEMNL